MAARRCPICGKPATEASRPFCSNRCKDIDLNRWLSGRYVIPGPAVEDDDAERPADRSRDDGSDD
jgi:endogenous inhibitor of DNA gyrase (YacG/DUF329 family)